MISFDVKDLARNLMIPNMKEVNVREHLVCELIRGAVEIFNDPHLENEVITRLEEVLENDYEVMGTEKLVLGMVKEMRRNAKSAGWDKRSVAQLEYKLVGKAFHRITVKMDLDETVARILAKNTIVQDPEHVTDMVSDHPDMDQLNELSKLHTRETTRRTPLLSDRLATCVRDDEKAGWRTDDWERFGKR